MIPTSRQFTFLVLLGGMLVQPCNGDNVGKIPLIRSAPGLFNQNNRETLGLKTIARENILLYKASADGMKYSHHSHLAVFKDTLYAMWSAGPVDEDSAGQHVVFSRSHDGKTWSSPQILVPDPDGPQGPLRATAGGWWVQKDKMIAYYTVFAEAKSHLAQKWSDLMRLEVIMTSDGLHWSAPQIILQDFLINEGPRRLASGSLLMTGEDQRGITRLVLSASPDGLHGWHDTNLPLPSLKAVPNEPTWYTRADGKAVMLFRDDNGSKRFYASLLNDSQTSWSMPVQTESPDATSKARAGNLPDGTVYIISNPGIKVGRSILTLALSADGILFNRAFILRNEPTQNIYKGLHKGSGYQYPNSLVWDGWLYVIYSVNKEDVMVTRVRLDYIN